MNSPLSTSYTQSGNSSTSVSGTDPIKGGAPEKDTDELTENGAKNKEKK